MGCENPIRMETKVHEDGSLDKTIVLDKADSSKAVSNHFGVNQTNDWTTSISNSNIDSRKLEITFQKKFASARESNQDLNKTSDTLFCIESNFEKQFRWFYTYISYSETLRPIDRFKKINPEDYFNQEDRSFIDRLPGEGTAISKADSVFLHQLNEKIYDRYANDALYFEFYEVLARVINENALDKKWINKLSSSKEMIYKKIDKWDGESNLAVQIADTLGIPLQAEKAASDLTELSKDISSRVKFMGYARDGKYTNIIEMPWAVINSNADSVAGNRLYYRPLPTKFAIQSYTMFAESRKLNIWAVVVSLLIVGATIIVLTRRKTS